MDYDYAILGAGASGLLLAEALLEHPDLNGARVLILEKDNKVLNDRTWCFWEEGDGAFDQLLAWKWERIHVAGPGWSLDKPMNPFTYKMIRSARFYESYRSRLSEYDNLDWEQAEVRDFEEKDGGVEIRTDKTVYTSQYAFSSIPGKPVFKGSPKYPLIQQHFLGWFLETDAPVFDAARVTFMDFSIPQKGNTRFMYILPTAENKALVEYTLFSAQPLPREEYETALKEYMQEQFPGVGYRIEEEEAGNIPMTCYPFWEATTEWIMPIGISGGWAKPSSGYTFARSAREARRLANWLTTGRPLMEFKSRDRFWFYDLLLLDVLYRENQIGSKIFLSLFRKRPIPSILRFLDEQTNLVQEVSMMSAPRSWPFIQALLGRLRKGF